MIKKTSSPQGVLLRMAAISLAVGVAVVACIGDLTELYPPDGGYPDYGGTGSDAGGNVDMTMAGPAKFFPDIQADVERLGCTVAGCHATGTQPILVAAPATPTDRDANYNNFATRAMAGDMSLILTKNLGTSGVSHGGPKPFASTSDATYVKWLAWINAGRVKE